MQRKPRAGANRTTHSHTYYTRETTTFSKLNTYILYKYERITISLISIFVSLSIYIK